MFTALLAWFVFHENFDRRIALGMLAILAGGVLLSLEGRLAWDSLAERETKWTAFQSDPEWIAKRAETEKDGQIVANIVTAFLQPTRFSSVK